MQSRLNPGGRGERLRRANKRDARHAEMVADLRRLYFSVADTSRVGDDFPDLIVGRQGLDMMVEVKTRLTKHKPKEGTDYLSDGQAKFAAAWKGAKPFAAFTAEEVANEFGRRMQKAGEWKKRMHAASLENLKANQQPKRRRLVSAG
jgi:hypothetical protein